MTMHQVTIERKLTQNRDQSTGLQHIKQRAVASNRKNWEVARVKKYDPVQQGGYWLYRYTLFFQKVKGQKNNANVVGKEWESILDIVAKSCNAARFQDYPWRIVSHQAPDDDVNTSLEEDYANGDINDPVFEEGEDETVVTENNIKVKKQPGGVRHAGGPDDPVSFQEIKEEKLEEIDVLIKDQESL